MAKAERYSDPYPVKLDTPTEKVVLKLRKKTGLTNSEILRRAVRYASPKFLSGEVNISDVPELSDAKG